MKKLEEHALLILKQAKTAHGQGLVYPCSMGAEGSVLIDMICRHALQIPIITLDTGRLPEETYRLIEEVEARYGIRVKVVFPDTEEVETMVQAHGINLFRKSVELRKLCCEVRKVRPLQRALAGYCAWITGRRREQSAERARLQSVEEDPVYGLIKYNPLLDWRWQDVLAYIENHRVPYNRLLDRHYQSIGCACCTRPITVGEDPRAGRWWWEMEAVPECGLHMNPLDRVQGKNGEGI